MEREFIYTIQDVHKMWERDYETQIGVMQSKIIEAIVKTNGDIAVSYSGGKDSGMLLYMTARVWYMFYGNARPLVVIFANTGCEFNSMFGFIKWYVSWLEERCGIKIDLRKASAKQPFAQTVREIGYPFPSKKIARMISDVRKQMRDLGIDYHCVKPCIRGGIKGAEAMREMGFSHVAVCDITGIKSNNQPGTCVIPAKWAPLLDADFEVSEKCCAIHKKGPIHAIEQEMGGLLPMIGEMAANSRTRMESYRRTGCNKLFGGNRVSKPMGPVTEQAVNRYYYETRLPLSPPYGEAIKDGDIYKFSGEQNTGCKLCGFGIMYDWDRFDRLSRQEPETVKWAFSRVEDGGLGYTEVCRYINAECKGKIVIPKL